MDLWRISRFADLSGRGGQKYSGRWHTAGHPVVYLADSLAAAMLETLVHLEIADDEVPVGYVALSVSVPRGVKVETLAVDGETWYDRLSTTQAVGDAWLEARSAALARVPSALLQDTNNYLLNPLHPDAAKVRIASNKPLRFDPRLLRHGR